MPSLAVTAVMSTYTVYENMEKIDDLSDDFPNEFKNRLNTKYDQIKGFNQNQAMQAIIEYNFKDHGAEIMSIIEKHHFKIKNQDSELN